MKMLASNKKGKRKALYAIQPHLAPESHLSSYDNAVANAPQHNGHIYNIHINSAGTLDSSVTPSDITGHAGNPSSIPHSLPNAIEQLQAIGRTQPTAPPSSVIRPATSSRRSSKRKQRLRSIVQFFLFFLISAFLLLCIGVVIMLIFNAKESSFEQTPNIQHGFFNSWIDYDYPGIWQRKVTLSTAQAELIAGLAMLILALSIPSAYLLLVRMTARLCDSLVSVFHRGRNAPITNLGGETATLLDDQDPEANEQTGLLSHPQQRVEKGLWSQIYSIWILSTSPQSSVIGFMALASYREKFRNTSSSWKHYGEYAGTVVLSILFSLLAIAVFFTLAFSTILSSHIITDSIVLSNHPDCGIWLRDSRILAPSSTGYDYLQEVEAVEHAQKCYHARPGTDGCNAFLAQKIPHYNNSHRECPFEDSLCLDGRFSAYTLETGTPETKTVSSKLLGINVEIGYSFRRTTTCSPIQRRTSLSGDEKTYEYNYGPSSGFGNLTWISLANPRWDFAGYNVATFFYKRNASSYNWQPSADFRPSKHQAITLLLVQSRNNYHMTPQLDPIFPAKRSTPSSPGHVPLYFNDDPIATALACVDNTEICDPSGKICFPDIYNPSPQLPGTAEEIGYYMLIQALVDSTTFQAIQLLGGRALVAEAKLERTVSLPLAEEQWKVEAENLFEASLVRPQIRLRDYIQGRAAHDPEYSDRTQTGLEGMCHAYTFPGLGWKNVSVWGMVLISLLSFSIWVLSIELQGPSVATTASTRVSERQRHSFDAEEEAQPPKIGQRILIAEWILNTLFESVSAEGDPEADQGQLPEQDSVFVQVPSPVNGNIPKNTRVLRTPDEGFNSEANAGPKESYASPTASVEDIGSSTVRLEVNVGERSHRTGPQSV